MSESFDPAALKRIRDAISNDPQHFPYAVVWPRTPEEIPDDTLQFRVAYLGPEWIGLDEEQGREKLGALYKFCGQTRRQFRNALAFAIPDTTAFRVACETGGQKTADSAAGFMRIYPTLDVPYERGGFQGNAGFRRVPNRLASDPASIFASALDPRELARMVGFGEKDCAGIRRVVFPMADAARWFFCSLSFPRFPSVEPIRGAIAEGIEQGLFGVLRSQELLGLDAIPARLKAQTFSGKKIDPREIKFENGHYLVWGEALRA